MRGLLVGCAFLFFLVAGAAAQSSRPPVDGAYARAHRPLATANSEAQAAFDDGLTLLYAFNPEEARRSFARAAEADPGLALAWWGVAMSNGANINTTFDPVAQQRGRAAIARARALARAASPVERALIEAVARRFAFTAAGDADRSARAYSDAMAAAAGAFPSDDDVATLAAEAEMDSHPWDYFTSDGHATPGTDAIIGRLEAVLARSPGHIGANHFLIHAYEESPHPERALGAARRLAGLSFEPAAEHLAHMPAHAFMRVGDYRAAGEANARALDLYRTYLAGDHAGHGDYFAHDCRFGVDAFMMSGDYEKSRALALSCNGGAGGLLGSVDLRFRRYDALAGDENPGAFATGMLAVHERRFADAARQLASLRKDGGDAAKVASAVLAAALQGAHGDASGELSGLEKAVALQDAQGYSEPPRFWYPVRESLGGALARAGRWPDAERTFRADLVRNPDNPRSLFGLAACLTHEDRGDDAKDALDRFTRQWAAEAARPTLGDL